MHIFIISFLKIWLELWFIFVYSRPWNSKWGPVTISGSSSRAIHWFKSGLTHLFTWGRSYCFNSEAPLIFYCCCSVRWSLDSYILLSNKNIRIALSISNLACLFCMFILNIIIFGLLKTIFLYVYPIRLVLGSINPIIME